MRPVGFITLNAEPEALRMLREKLPMTIEQWQWLHGKDHIAYSLLNYIESNPTVANAKRNAFEVISVSTGLNIQMKFFPLQILNAMTLNPNLVFDVQASYFSPFNIDRSEITNGSPEGQKFNEIYDSLIKSPEFKNLFVSMFDNSTKFNVKFELAEHVYEDNDRTKKEVHATTMQDPVSKNIVIKISNQILRYNGTMSQTKIENAKTVLHECIHAFLFVKANNPSVGADFVKILNTMYPNAKEQHDFMYINMIPTMQKVLGEIRDLVTTEERRNYLADINVSPTPSTNTIIWNWSDYYRYLSLNGLQSVNSFKDDFPDNSNQFLLFKSYIDKGNKILDK